MVCGEAQSRRPCCIDGSDRQCARALSGRRQGDPDRLAHGYGAERRLARRRAWRCHALEIARSAIEAKEGAAIGIDVINFQDEEGTFLPFLGSRTFFASVDEAEIEAARSAHGAALAAALDPICREPPPHRFEAGRHLCYLQAHIEQGPRLEAAGQRIGVVSGLVGIRRIPDSQPWRRKSCRNDAHGDAAGCRSGPD